MATESICVKRKQLVIHLKSLGATFHAARRIQNGRRVALASASSASREVNPDRRSLVMARLSSRLCVVDLDRKDGVDGVSAFVREFGRMRTSTVETPSGGLHLYFRSPWPCSSKIGKYAPGFDILGESTFVALPGARTSVGAYRLCRLADIAPLPAELARFARARRTEKATALGAAETTPYGAAILRALAKDLANSRGSSYISHEVNRLAFIAGQWSSDIADFDDLVTAAIIAGMDPNDAERCVNKGVAAGSRYPKKKR